MAGGGEDERAGVPVPRCGKKKATTLTGLLGGGEEWCCRGG